MHVRVRGAREARNPGRRHSIDTTQRMGVRVGWGGSHKPTLLKCQSQCRLPPRGFEQTEVASDIREWGNRHSWYNCLSSTMLTSWEQGLTPAVCHPDVETISDSCGISFLSTSLPSQPSLPVPVAMTSTVPISPLSSFRRPPTPTDKDRGSGGFQWWQSTVPDFLSSLLGLLSHHCSALGPEGSIQFPVCPVLHPLPVTCSI